MKKHLYEYFSYSFIQTFWIVDVLFLLFWLLQWLINILLSFQWIDKRICILWDIVKGEVHLIFPNRYSYILSLIWWIFSRNYDGEDPLQHHTHNIYGMCTERFTFEKIFEFLSLHYLYPLLVLHKTFKRFFDISTGLRLINCPIKDITFCWYGYKGALTLSALFT